MRGKKRKDSIYRFSDSYAFKFLIDYKDSLDLEPYTFNYEPYFPDYRDYELNLSDLYEYQKDVKKP